MLYLPYAALLAVFASATKTPDVQLNNYLKMDFSVLRGNSRSTAAKGAREGLVARGDLFTLELANGLSYYSSTLKVGFNGDENTVLVDTGSSDLWIMSSDVACYKENRLKRSVEDITPMSHRLVFDPENSTNIFEKRDNQDTSLTLTSKSSSNPSENVCLKLGSFSTEASESFHLNSSAPPFSIRYADESYAKGVWGSDSVSIGSLSVPNCNFAIVNETTSDVGVFGIGLPGLEVTSVGSRNNSYMYENFPIQLKKTGAIQKVAYSLYLNDVYALSGSILFGAVDHSKYSGQLQTIPLVNVYKRYFENPITFDVMLDSISLESSFQKFPVYESSFTALLDSGTTISYLPLEVISSIAASLEGELLDFGLYQVDCIYNTTSVHTVFNFSGIEIKVPLSDLIMKAEMVGGPQCILGLIDLGGSSSVLGDNFLRHAYIVYDLEQYEVSMAQVKFSNSESIEIISSSVPRAVKAPGFSAPTTSEIDSESTNHLTFTTATSSWTESESSMTNLTSDAITATVGIPHETTSSSSWISSYTTTESLTSTYDLETSVEGASQTSSCVQISNVVSSTFASPMVSSMSISSNFSPSFPVSSVTDFSSSDYSVTASSVTTSSTAVSSLDASSGSGFLVGWNESYVSTALSEPVPANSLSSGSGSITTDSLEHFATSSTVPVSTEAVSNNDELTTDTKTSIYTSINEASSTVFYTKTFTTTHCTTSSDSVTTLPFGSMSNSLTTETKTSISTSINEVGSTVFSTRTYTTTYCPTQSTSSESSLTTEVKTSVSTSINEVGSTVRFTNTFTTTYCPESSAAHSNKTTVVTFILTVGKPGVSQGSVSSQGVPTKTSDMTTMTLEPFSSTHKTVLHSQAVVESGTSTISGISISTGTASNRTITSSSFDVPHTSSLIILQGGSSVLSIILTMLLVPILALL